MSDGRMHEMKYETRGSGQVKENEIGPGGGGEGTPEESVSTIYTSVCGYTCISV